MCLFSKKEMASKQCKWRWTTYRCDEDSRPSFECPRLDSQKLINVVFVRQDGSEHVIHSNGFLSIKEKHFLQRPSNTQTWERHLKRNFFYLEATRNQVKMSREELSSFTLVFIADILYVFLIVALHWFHRTGSKYEREVINLMKFHSIEKLRIEINQQILFLLRRISSSFG